MKGVGFVLRRQEYFRDFSIKFEESFHLVLLKNIINTFWYTTGVRKIFFILSRMSEFSIFIQHKDGRKQNYRWINSFSSSHIDQVEIIDFLNNTQIKNLSNKWIESYESLIEKLNYICRVDNVVRKMQSNMLPVNIHMYISHLLIFHYRHCHCNNYNVTYYCTEDCYFILRLSKL